MQHVHRQPFSLRRPARTLLGRALVHVLIAVLGLGLVPIDAEASISTVPPPEPRPLEQIGPPSEPACLAVTVVADPARLTKSAFGELLEHTGTDPQPYSFAGEPYDPNVGFQYHRARWMDPGTGRFLGMDPHGGNLYDPPSLHKYAYVAADPVNRLDPTGLFGDLSTALTSVAGQITAIGARLAIGTITRLGAIRALRALNWTSAILTAAYNRFGNIAVSLEHALERGTGRVDIVLKAAPQVIRRAVVEGKAWSLDAIAMAPGRAVSMLEQLRHQAGQYALEFGDDLIHAFPELPQTAAGQALLRQAQSVLTSAGVQRVTFGVQQLIDEVAILLER